MAGSKRGANLMDVSVEIHCEACGSANYSLPEGDGDEAPIRCNDCSAHQGTIGELRAALRQQVIDHSAEALRRDLDRLLEAKL
jgi:DNA-directed RNA polymerase subunit RPC12/RpoP